MSTMIGVLINSTSSDDHEWSSIHNTDDHIVALDRSVKKHFGKTAFFEINHGLSNNNYLYGQIFKPLKNDCAATSVTPVVTVQFF